MAGKVRKSMTEQPEWMINQVEKGPLGVLSLVPNSKSGCQNQLPSLELVGELGR